MRVKRMNEAFVPRCWGLVTRDWIDHPNAAFGTNPFVTTKTHDAAHGERTRPTDSLR
jgi:hypothetical protein